MRLNVYIAKSGFCSRRKASLLVKEGRVKVNEKVICEPWFELKESDSVKVNDKNIRLEKNIYIIFNKPTGVTATLKDKFAYKKIIDFIPKYLGRIYPIGRLDKNSRGLMILTNDGNLCYKLTHPKFEVEKEYVLWVKGALSDSVLERLKKGVKEDKDVLKVKTVFIEALRTNKTKIRAVVYEGKKRHLRRLFGFLGHPVLDLKRVRIGDLRLGDLKEGTFKIIDKKAILN